MIVMCVDFVCFVLMYIFIAVTYTETLPEDDCAPSHRGHSVKYTYKVTLGIQHANEPVHMMRIPFRLITIGTTAASLLYNSLNLTLVQMWVVWCVNINSRMNWHPLIHS